MEIGTRAAAALFGAEERSPGKKKLTQIFKVTRSTPVESKSKSKSKAVNTRLQEVDEGLCRLPTLVRVKPEPMECHGPEPPASLLCRASTIFAQYPTSEAAPSLQMVKRELLSPSSCVTNDTEGAVCNSVESLATAHANLMGSKCLHAASDVPDVAGESLPLPVASEALQPLPEQVASAPLMTALVMMQESFKHPSNATRVKTEAVEPPEKLITALDMLGGGGLVSSPTSSDTEAHLERKELEIVHAPEAATPMKLMTALHMFPEKREPMEVDVGCGKGSHVANVPPGLRSVSLHVKSEPLTAFPELEPLAFPKESVVKDEFLDSPLETNQSGEGAHVSSDSEDGSEENGDGCLRTQVQNGTATDCEDIVETLSQKSQNGEKSQKELKPRNGNPGFRIQGGRLYDSEFGKTCHWCRQKTVEHHVKCRECTIHYCGPCLMNRNGENVREELCEGVSWLCPKCRNGCGPGCENCCNCGPCRKALGKPPTGQLIGVARNVGFDNAHDYLVHLETGESPEEIARRKVGRDWTNGGRFKCKDTSETSESGDGTSSSSEGVDEFTLNEETSTQLHQGILDMKFVKKFVESQKRKRVAMRAPLPAKRSQLEASPAIKRRDVDSIVARLKVTGQSLSKEKEGAVKSATHRVTQKFKTIEKYLEDDSSIRNQDSEMRTRACKREYVEINDGSNFSGSDLETSAVAKRRKLDGDQRLVLLNEFLSSRSSLLSPFSEVKCKIEPITTYADIPGGQGGTSFFPESDVILKMRGARALNGVSSASSQTMSEQQRGMECPIDPQGSDYRMKLKSALAQPFDAKELEALDYSVRCRKPVQKLRQMRGRIVDVVTEDEGLSYLDHHQDFTAKLEEAQSPPEKLALLRGFFFWLQHSCMEGAFRPWPSALAQSRHQSGECIETEGPDCQVTAVVLPLDEGNEANRHLKRTFMKTVQRPLEMTSFPLGSGTSGQFLIPFQAKKKFGQPVKPKMRAQLMVPPAITYQVVLGLPAPALYKI